MRTRVYIRKAAVLALVQQFSAGRDDALREVVNVLLDDAEVEEIRIAAFALVPHLPARQQRGVVQPLCDDRSRALRNLARRFSEAPREQELSSKQLPGWIERLADEDYVVWNEAIQKLSDGDASIVDPLIDAMCVHANEPDFCRRAAIVLKSLGPRRSRSKIGDALERVDQPLALQTLIEVIGAMRDRALTYRLKDLIDRLAEQPIEERGFDPCLRVRAQAHRELAKIGSRVAIADLRETLNRRDVRPEEDMLRAIARIGKKDELPLLIRLWMRETEIARQRIGKTVLKIMRRERIRRNSKIFSTLTGAQRDALEQILPPRRRSAAAADRKRSSA